MSNLQELFEKYGTDKATHGYAQVYEPLLRSLRQSIHHVLEVGIGTLSPAAFSSMFGCVPEHYSPGGSLRVWRDYFPTAVIWGLDTMPDTQFSEPRIVTKLGDSTDKAQTDAVLGDQSFDLIIDDGDHRLPGQHATYENLWPRLNPGGLYIVEEGDWVDPVTGYGELHGFHEPLIVMSKPEVR
jgi:hypothetical protein